MNFLKPLTVILFLGLGAAAQETAAPPLHPIAAKVKMQLKKPDKGFTMIVSCKVKTGQAKAFIDAFRPAVEKTLQEPGNRQYTVTRDQAEPDKFVVIERWKSLAALETHLASAHVTKLFQDIGPLLEGEPSLQVVLPVAEVKKPKAAGKPAAPPAAVVPEAVR